MAFAFTHLVFAWILGKGYEVTTKKNISHTVWFFLLFGSILPDSDMIADFLFGLQIHRTFTHSILWIIVAAVFVSLFFYKQKEKKQFAIAISLGILTHLIIDSIFIPGIPWMWPFGTWYSLPIAQPVSHMSYAILDMGLGTGWLFWLWWKEKVSF